MHKIMPTERPLAAEVAMRVESRRVVAVSLTVVALISCSPGESHAGERQFEPQNLLRGVSRVRVEVSGLPLPVGDARISEHTIRGAIRETLDEAGLWMAAPGEFMDTPTLRVTVLAPRCGDALHAYMLTVELEEACILPRRSDYEIARCSTWSIYPRVGFFPVGKEEVLVGVALLAVDQFIDAWIYANGKQAQADV